jgi:hypothetical protein
MTEITFKQFATAAGKHHTPESLAERFKGKIDRPLEFFHRVMNSPEQASLVIPYRSVVEMYDGITRGAESAQRKHCACGCKKPVFDRQKWASPGCKKSIARKKATDMQKVSGQVSDFVDARPGQKRVMATLPSTKCQKPAKTIFNGSSL